ncbi:Fic family protein [Paenibacillus albidus]|uniref:Fic/DOC family protein n=1 Tax=Paenibacillus albidus TaxID=2041023 RepID=UPI001BE784F6|nr:Fic family protein [Paenibacillus albidus]MBT2293751.1 Fic family protein [Paenibacillus albidus]
MSEAYLYPGTNVLVNLAGLRDQELLDIFERNRSALRLMELQAKPIQGNFDLKHLQTIHKHLFQDVYPFAGNIRTTNIGKDNFWFSDYPSIQFKANNIFTSLKDENHFKHTTLEQFANKAAALYSDLNYLDPFREGNGRSTREYFRLLAKDAGYELKWSNVPKEQYMDAVVKATDNPAKHMSELSAVFLKCIKHDSSEWNTPEHPIPLKDILKLAEGMPAIHNSLNITSDMLKQPVERFKIEPPGKGKEKLQFQFQGSKDIHKVTLEKPPFMTAQMKNQWLEIAANNVGIIQIRSPGIGLGD